MATNPAIAKIAKLATDFVIQHNGNWGHEEWTAFCGQVQASGWALSDDNQLAIGNLLEALKHLNAQQPATAATPRKAPAKKKAAPKKS